MSDAAEDAAFSKAVDRFRAGLTRDQRDQFAGCDKTEVEKTIAEIQLRHGSQRRQKNMRRVAKFIEGMSQLGQVIEVFLNVEVSVAFIWGPIKFLLQTASTWVETLDLLLDTYAEIGETLPGLSRYEELFKQHPLVGKQLENYYCDVLEFNKCALEVFSRPGWKTIFYSTWKTFKTNFGPILSSFRRHKTLLSEEKLTALMSEVQSNFEQLRNDISLRDAQDQARMLAEAEERRRHQLRVLREDLDAPDSHQDQDNSFAVLQDSSSGVWIASEPTLKAWSDPSSTHSSFLFLSGIPGAGKTTLTSGIINHLLNLQKKEELRGNKIMVAYFYFKHTHEDKRTLHKMVRSVLSQLIDQDPSLLDHVYKELCGTSRISLDQAKEMAQLAIRSARLCFLVVDGLDECVKDENSRTTEAEKVINWLMELTIPAPGAQNSDIRVLVSSQRDGVIEEKLREHPTLQLESLQPHDNDIERFVRMQARVISEVFPDSEAIDEEKIVEKITTAAKGMFLYAKVVLDNLLEQETAFDFAAELQEKNFPKGLEEAYDRIVRRVLKTSKESKRRIAEEILGYVVCAHRPLRWREIQSLFCIDPRTGTADMTRRPFRSCKHFCSSLVDVLGCNGDTNDPEGRVELVHVSAKHYLINAGSVCLATEHARMALFMSRYLASKPFDLKAFERIQSYVLSGYYNMHDYAVTSWWYHTHEAIALRSSLSTDVFSEMIYSLSAHLQFHLEVQAGESSNPPTPNDILAQFRQLSTNDPAREDLGNLSARVRTIREVVETIWILMPHNTDIQKSIGLKFYGQKQYKCFNSWCHRFSDGFQGSRQRNDHMDQHARPFRCSVEGCFAGALGLSSERQLQQHVNTHHQGPEEPRFPAARLPKKHQSLAATIRAGNLEALKKIAGESSRDSSSFDIILPLQQLGGLRALTVAVESKQLGICQYLLDKGASVFRRELGLAIAQGDCDILRLLISHISSTELLALTPIDFFSSATGLADLDAERTFVKAIEIYHPWFHLSDLFLRHAMKQGLLEIVKHCLACENDRIAKRLKADYHNWMDCIVAASQECLQVLLSNDRSGVLTTQLFFEAHGDGNEDMLSRLPSLTPELSDWICLQGNRNSFANDSRYRKRSKSLMRVVSKSQRRNIWAFLGASFCFLPLDIRLNNMDRSSLREMLIADDSLFLRKDKAGATILHGIIHSDDFEMFEWATSVGVDLNGNFTWHNTDGNTTPIRLALEHISNRSSDRRDASVVMFWSLLSTGRIDLSEIEVDDELLFLIATGKATHKSFGTIIEKGLARLCPTATTDEIQRLHRELPALTNRLQMILHSSPWVEMHKRDFKLAEFVAHPYSYIRIKAGAPHSAYC